jgi:hypothetical protein
MTHPILVTGAAGRVGGVGGLVGEARRRRGLPAVLGGNLVMQILSWVVVVRTMQLGAGTAVAPGVVIHVVLGSLFGFFLFKARKL